MTLSLGLGTFGDISNGPDGQPLRHDQVLRNVVAEGVLAEQVGVDHFGIGEHHREDFAVSSPETVLAALAARTGRMTIGSAVTVLSSDDPVRVFQRFSTLNAIADGRAEAILGRGSFTESFPLFGLNLQQYEILFEEKLDLFVKLLREDRVTWSGQTRAALNDQGVYPTLPPQGLSAWIGVGGSPESVVRAVRHDLPMMLAIIGGDPRRFRPFVDLYHRAYDQIGGTPKPLGVHSMGFVAETDEAARETLYPHYKAMMDKIGGERGWPPLSRDRFIAEVEGGALNVGSPETVARKIAGTIKALGLQRFDMKYSHGTLPHEDMCRTIELYGTRVIPMVRDMIAGAAAA